MGLILFLDESGDHSLSKIDPQYPVFVLCGIIIEENYHNSVAADTLNHFKDELFGRRDVILHTADFTRNQNGFESMVNHDFRVKFFVELQKMVAALDFKVIACAIRKQEHLRRYGLRAVDPYMLSLSVLIERFIFESGSAGGSVIAEARDATLNNALELAFLDLKIRGTEYVSATKVQKRIHSFGIREKRESIVGLQLADLCATPIGRHCLGKSTYPHYSEQGDFWCAVERKLRCNRKGETSGTGLIKLPK